MRLSPALLALTLASAAHASINLEARRLAFDRPSYAPTDAAQLTLTYRPTGSATTLKDVRVDVEVRSNPSQRAAFRIREIVVPQGDREFVMPLDLSKLSLRDGTYDVTATIDGNDAFGESYEDDNDVSTTLVIASPGRTTTTTTTTGTTTSDTTRSGARSIAPTTQRVVASTTCSMLEREWSSPAEVGFHPGYGTATLVVNFDHPMTLLRSGERVRRATLRIVGDVVGRPFTELGALQATIRTKASSSSRCASVPDAKLTMTSFDGDAEIDLSRAMDDADTLPLDCAQGLQAILSFPEPRTDPPGGSLIRLAPQGATLEVEIGR
jgi:hypothetical protein